MAAGSSPIYKEGIGPALHPYLHAGRLRFTTHLAERQVGFIAVGTSSRQDGQAGGRWQQLP